MGRLARIAAALLLLVLVVVVIGALTSRRAGPRAPMLPTTSPPSQPTQMFTTTTTTTTTTSAPPIPTLPLMGEPVFTASLETVGAVPRGGSFDASLFFEGHNGFSGSVELEVAGVFYHTSHPGVGAHLLRPGLVNVSAPGSVDVPGRASVRIDLSQEAPLGRYSVVIVARGGGYASTILIPFRVYAYPSYIIKPVPSVEVVRAGEWAEITLQVEPIGPLNQTVRLGVGDAAWGVEAEILGGEGVPPFNATLRIRVNDLWQGMSENTTSNRNLYVVVSGSPPGPTSVIWLGLEEVKRESILGTLLGVLTLPVRVITGISIGLLLEFSYGLVLPTVPTGELLAAGVRMTLPELEAQALQSPEGFQGATINRANHWTTFLRLGVASSSKPASILAPAANLPIPLTDNATIPLIIYVDNPATAEVEARRVWSVIKIFPPMKETRTGPASLTLQQDQGRLIGFVSISGREPGQFLEITVRDKATGRVLDKVEIKYTRGTGPPPVIVAVARPGETLAIPVAGIPDIREVEPIEWIAEGSYGNLTLIKPRPPIKPLEGLAEAMIYQSIPPDKSLPPGQVMDLEIRKLGNETSILLVRLKPGIEPGTYSARTGALITPQGSVGCIVHLIVLGQP